MNRSLRARASSTLHTLRLALAVSLAGLIGCAESGSDLGGSGPGDGGSPPSPDARALGPADGRDLPAMDLERVQVGEPAPDFTLPTYAGDTLTLSDLRGRADVILVFYRGHW